MKRLQFVHLATLVAILGVVPKVMAEPPVVHQSTQTGTPAVSGGRTQQKAAPVFSASKCLKGREAS